MKQKTFTLVIMILLIVARLCAQSTTTLSQAINAAFINRNNIQADKIDITIQQLKTKSLYKKYGPQVSAEYNYTYNPILQSSIIPVGKFNSTLPPDATATIQFGTTWTQSAGITATQPLFDATIKKQINESLLLEKISRTLQAQSAYELAYEVSKAYLNTWLQQQQISSAIIDTARTWLSYQLQLENYTAGRLLKSELNNANINHNNTKQQLTDAIIQLVENKIYLMYVTGTLASEANDFNIDTTFFKNNILLLIDTNISVDSIPVFQQLNFQKQLSLLQQQTEKSKYLPVVSLKSFLGANQFTNDFNPVKSNSWFGYSYIGLNVKVPILLADDKKNKIKQLQLQSQQYSLRLDEKSAQFNQEAATAKLELTRIKLQLKTQEENIILYEEILKILQDRFKEGQITSNELNSQEKGLQKLLTDYQNTKVEGWLFGLSYLNSTGQLSKLWR
ncbi:MAG: TolC family protein [Bacteroidota bacterium]|nr:TolC family protein [Bacteroidota bacterium]